MYRIAYNPGKDSKGIIRELVSDQIIDGIETIFGPLNEEGHFTDIFRVWAFMSKSDYLRDLVNETYVSGTGLLKTEIPWTQIIKTRYEDILLKIKDKKHAYTFNEVGEGLIHLIFEFFASCDYSYLFQYEDIDEEFDDFGAYIGVLERTDYPGLREFLNQAGRDVFDDLSENLDDEILEQYEMDSEMEEYDRQEFANYYEELWYNYFLEPVNLAYEGYRCSGLFKFVKEVYPSKYAHEWEECLISDVLFWDNDFAFVMPLLGNKKEMNRFVKNCGDYLGYKVRSADAAALSTDDDAAHEI